MADRNLLAAVEAELAKNQMTLAHLFHFGFDAPDYICDGRVNITWDGNEYGATGDILEVPSIAESFVPALDAIDISVSGVNLANVYKALAVDYANVPVVIYRALLDTNYDIVGEAVEVYSGFIDAPSFQEDPRAGTAKMTWKVSSIWAAFDRTAGRRGNNADQQKWYPGDLGFEFASKDYSGLKWGTT